MSQLVAKLKDIAPYEALELVMPGGSVMALLLWIYRLQNNGAVVSDLHAARHAVCKLAL
jgi:hypothetical protein